MLDAFRELDRWFDVDASLMKYKPADGGWSIHEILEHVSLTNHYLLILIRRGTFKAIERSMRHPQENIDDYELNREKLQLIGEPGAFSWNRPEHMRPHGKVQLNDIRQQLTLQGEDCLALLDSMKNGEGIYYKIQMTVNSLGKIDMYHYLYFLMQHMKRHIVQMKKIKAQA